jgi:hypothetical protein
VKSPNPFSDDQVGRDKKTKTKIKMNKKTFHILEIGAGIIVGSLISVILFALLPADMKAALPIFHRAPSVADIEIKAVSLEKVEGATHPYYSRYRADVVIKNNGKSLKNVPLVLSSGGKRLDAEISPETHEFSLGYNDEVVIKDYNVFVDKNLNGEIVDFEVSVEGIVEENLENNVYKKGVVDFENEGLGDLEITNIDGGEVTLDPPMNLGEEFDYYLLHSYRVDSFPDKVFGYKEFLSDGKVFSYYSAPAEMGDLAVLKGFNELEADPLSPVVSFSTNVYEDMSPHVFVLKAVNKDKSVYSYSNLIVLPVQTLMNRAEFAKILVEEAGIELIDDGSDYFKDIEGDEWFSPYVKTLLNKGFLKTSVNLNPAEPISRGEVASVLVEAFDLPFKVKDGASHFADVAKEHPAYYAVEALYNSGFTGSIVDKFLPESQASRAFLLYFIKQK